jgi:membrane-associated protein
VLASLVDVAQTIGLPLLFALIAVATMGIPVPGETALITAAVVAGRGELSIEAVIAVAAAAAIVGDNVGFALGRHLGRRVLRAPGPFLHHRLRVLDVGEPFFERHGAKAVFLGRWVTGLRITSAWLAGANRMSWPRFLPYNAAGGIAWAASVGLACYVLGRRAESAIHAVGLAALAVTVSAVLGAWITLRVRRRREASAEG